MLLPQLTAYFQTVNPSKPFLPQVSFIPWGRGVPVHTEARGMQQMSYSLHHSLEIGFLTEMKAGCLS